MAIDVHFRTGAVQIEKRKFSTAEAALAWATKFSKDFGLPTP